MQRTMQQQMCQRGFEKKVFGTVAAIMLLLSLTGCGSGAVSSPATPSTSPLVVSPPSADIFPDIPTTFTVTGGTPAYTAFSSNSVVLPITAAVTGNTFTVIAKSVTADTAIDITVRDSVSAAPFTAKATVKPTTLNNQITFTPVGPTGNGCGTNAMCSGGDALFAVSASLNGVVLKNRAIRFDAAQGNFQLVTPGTNALVSSLQVNTDEQGQAVARVTASAGAATQVATLQSTDVTSGLVRRYSFNIAQVTSGTGILSTLPSGSVTITGAPGAAGQDGTCPIGGRVDYYIFGGTPPYAIASLLPNFASVSPSSVNTNGGSFTVQILSCGKAPFKVSDATGRVVETSTVEGVAGAKGTTIPAAPLTITPTTLTIACGASASVGLSGSGTFSSSVASGTGGNGFSVTPTAGSVPSTVSVSASSGAIISPVTVNFVSSLLFSSNVPISVNVTGLVNGACP